MAIERTTSTVGTSTISLYCSQGAPLLLCLSSRHAFHVVGPTLFCACISRAAISVSRRELDHDVLDLKPVRRDGFENIRGGFLVDFKGLERSYYYISA